MRLLTFILSLTVSCALMAQPDQSAIAKKFYEAVYLQTNKCYYYKGENIWFKAYMNYSSRTMRDTLSKVLYVDLINDRREIVRTRTLRIDTAHAVGMFSLPVDIPRGTYALVAYTNWMRNYGEDKLFIQPVPVLDPYEAIAENVTAPLAKNSPGVIVISDSARYHKRTRVKIAVLVRDEKNKPEEADLSVAVTDVRQVKTPTWERKDIIHALMTPETVHVPGKFTYRVEYGVTFQGQFKFDLGKKSETSITVVRAGFGDVRKMNTDENGNFSMFDVDVTDSAMYFIQMLNQKGKGRGGAIVEIKRTHPLISFDAGAYVVPIQTRPTLQNLPSPFELPKEAILLHEVEVTSRKIVPQDQMPNYYARANTVLTDKDIASYGSIEPLLRSRGVGYILQFTGSHWLFGTTRGAGIVEPFLAINNQEFFRLGGETVGDKLMSLIPDDIQRIEISSGSGINRSRAGVVAVFLKRGNAISFKEDFRGFFVKGYDFPKTFKGPEYIKINDDQSTSDNRSSLLWKDNLWVGASGQSIFSFYSSDQVGKYRIVIEGVTSKGAVVHFEKLIEVVE